MSFKNKIIIGWVWINIPVSVLMYGLLYSLFELLSLFENLMEKIDLLPFLFIVFAMIFISFIVGWLWWSITVVKWKIWAFSDLEYEDAMELSQKAISSMLIWPPGHGFNKTEIWTKKSLKKLSKINPDVIEIIYG